ncbi:MAG: DEAD/DEAH box helicase [Bacteriovoracaceae bacterium]|nr:DEAD/DEAH box helicase [Bacteriovoracaceae bacterium]
MLPIEKHLPAIIDQVSVQQATLLEASPGSGKTTMVPLELMKKFTGKILVLEPRRLATKWAAARAAQLLGEKIGQSVGYIYRFEKKVSDQTRLIFLTEGSFLKYLQTDSAMKDVSVVVIDEFHERHLNTDIAFGLIKQFNFSHLKLLIMSATLDEAPLKKFFPALGKITITAPIFPLEIRWSPDEAEWLKRDLEKKVLWGIQQALQLEGDILVFLPGLGEIKKIHSILEERLSSHPHLLLTLHGQESSDEDLILKPQSLRKIILASNVAESSITIPGIKIVIDSGLQREAHFLEWSSLTELVTLPCSQASAIQRAGRSARTGPGVCLRLYTEKDFNSRQAFTTPEVLKSDLAEVMLELAWWGIKLEDFSWINSPDSKKIQFAKELLHKLGALEDSKLSSVGKEMLQVPLSPKVARVWVEAKRKGSQKSFNETCTEISHWIEKGPNRKRLEERLKSFRANGEEEHCEMFWLTGFEDSIARYRQDKLNTVRGDIFSIGFEAKKNFNPSKEFWLVMDVNPVTKQATRLLPLEDDWVKSRAQSLVEMIQRDNTTQVIKRTILKIGSLTLESIDEILSVKNITPISLKLWIEEFKNEETYIRWTLFQKSVAPEKPLEGFEWDLFVEECLLDPENLSRERFFNLLCDELQLYIDHTFHFTLKNVCPKEFSLHEKKSVPIHYEMNQAPWIGSYIQDFFGHQTHPHFGLKSFHSPCIFGVLTEELYK